MSRRSQSRRRRTYGRRQHEVRERRPPTNPGADWVGDTDAPFDTEWQAADGNDNRASFTDSYGTFGQ